MNQFALVIVFLISSSAFALRVVDEQVILDKFDDYQLCQKKDYTGDWCHDALKRWVDGHPNDAFKAGKATRLAMNHWGAIPFFTQAFNQKMGDCKDDDVKLAVVSAIDLPYDSYKDVVEQARTIGMKTCYKEMKTAILDTLKVDSYAFKNLCKDVADKGDLSGLKLAKCKAMK